MMKISEILLNYESDKNKGSLNKSSGHTYGKTYDTIFSRFNQSSNIKILEIGVQNGGSLLAWKDYFKNGFIVGVDIEDQRKEVYKREDVYFILSDIKDQNLKDNELIKYNNFDIIIDDGSHYLEDVLFVVINYLSKINLNGYLIIEDCQNPEEWVQIISSLITENFVLNFSDLRIQTTDSGRPIKKGYDNFLIIIKRIK